MSPPSSSCKIINYLFEWFLISDIATLVFSIISSKMERLKCMNCFFRLYVGRLDPKKCFQTHFLKGKNMAKMIDLTKVLQFFFFSHSYEKITLSFKSVFLCFCQLAIYISFQNVQTYSMHSNEARSNYVLKI